MKTTIGGDRLGSGNNQEVNLNNFKRSTHDLSYKWRSPIAAGTLVPFMNQIGLAGDKFDIDLNCDVITLPTVGPLFGEFKVQLDVFVCPIRLYQGKLHMNKLGIGMAMENVKLPQIEVRGMAGQEEIRDNDQIGSSSILKYLGISGLGRNEEEKEIMRRFNAVPYLGVWEVYKNYYANKQENEGVVIHNNLQEGTPYNIESAVVRWDAGNWLNVLNERQDIDSGITDISSGQIKIVLKDGDGQPFYENIIITINSNPELIADVYGTLTYDRETKTITGSNYQPANIDMRVDTANPMNREIPSEPYDTPKDGVPFLTRFPLENIDRMREELLMAVQQESAYIINNETFAPYGNCLKKAESELNLKYSILSTQEGLPVKTYQSDLFNNWISTEWIDGDNGVNEITKVSTADGGFTIDSLNLANKVYNLLNRIAISGGDYDSWQEATYAEQRVKSAESPIYQGSLIKKLVFQEVIGTAETEIEGEVKSLGQLAGKGRLSSKHKGGKIKISIDEASFIIGLASITPIVDYSQGNDWRMNLETMNDFHKPNLDGIGYQDLITDNMAWFDTICDENGELELKSAGKQPAWINYMTEVNKVFGPFAEKNNQMFMVNNRRYESSAEEGITDLTTYIDPSKFNHIFADAELSAMNYWMQINVKNIARRKMSAKVIPNL